MKYIMNTLFIGLATMSHPASAQFIGVTNQVATMTSVSGGGNLVATAPGADSGVAGSISFAPASSVSGAYAVQTPVFSSAGAQSLSTADQYNISMSIGGASTDTSIGSQTSGSSNAFTGPNAAQSQSAATTLP